MKKTMAMFAVAAMAFSAQSAQINWGSQGALYNGAQMMTTVNGYTTQGYLVYLGPAGSTWVSAGFDPNAPIALGGDVVRTASANALGQIGTALSPYTGLTPGSTVVGAGPDIFTDGSSTFGIVFMSTGGAFGTDTYYFLGSPFAFDTTDTTAPGTYASTTSTYTYGQAVPSGSTWTPVTPIPEPGTAALALAGLALLIRRRK